LFEQLAHAFAQQRVSVLHRSGTFRARRVGQQRDPVRDEAGRPSHRHKAVEGIALLAVFGQPFPEVAQAGRVETGIIRRQVERHLPAPGTLEPLHGFLVRDIVVELEQQHTAQDRRRQARPAVAGVVHLFQIVVLEQDGADGCHPAIERIVWHPMRQVRR
jgi:hypothetical protein